MQCPACAAALPEDDLFCESCGQMLDPAHPLAQAQPERCSCGAPAADADEDGFCPRCGHRVRRPASDHMEQALTPGFAAVTDRGLRHERNEDRFAIFQSGELRVLVVCDGVSATRQSEIASSAVAEGILESLSSSLHTGAPQDPESALRTAVAAGAAELAARSPRRPPDNPPSTTAVAALVADNEATIAWVGDSRAYWIDAHGASALTRDHSWLNAVVAAGEMSPEQAERSPQAHAITRWIGVDAGESAQPDLVRVPLTPPGILLLCTDGLWNYAPSSEAMAQLFEQAQAAEADALGIARRLVQFALDRGGQDNITVALLRLPQPAAPQPAAPDQAPTEPPA